MTRIAYVCVCAYMSVYVRGDGCIRREKVTRDAGVFALITISCFGVYLDVDKCTCILRDRNNVLSFGPSHDSHCASLISLVNVSYVYT